MVSISSNQPTLNSSSEKYRACGVNERQEVNPLVRIGRVVSISSNQPSLNNSCEKYRACGVNERQEVNPLIALSDSESVNDLEKDEFRFSRDYLAYDFNDTRQSEHREQEQKFNS